MSKTFTGTPTNSIRQLYSICTLKRKKNTFCEWGDVYCMFLQLSSFFLFFCTWRKCVVLFFQFIWFYEWWSEICLIPHFFDRSFFVHVSSFFSSQYVTNIYHILVLWWFSRFSRVSWKCGCCDFQYFEWVSIFSMIFEMLDIFNDFLHLGWFYYRQYYM